MKEGEADRLPSEMECSQDPHTLEVMSTFSVPFPRPRDIAFRFL